jgi:hypothetical protein
LYTLVISFPLLLNRAVLLGFDASHLYLIMTLCHEKEVNIRWFSAICIRIGYFWLADALPVLLSWAFGCFVSIHRPYLLGKMPLAKKAQEKSLSPRARFNSRLEQPGWPGEGGAALTLGQAWLL